MLKKFLETSRIVRNSQTKRWFQAENVLDLKLDMPLRTTQEYAPPTICPQIKSIVTDVIRNETDNNHLVIKLPAHSVGRNASKLEQEGKYKQATRVMVDMHNYRCVFFCIWSFHFVMMVLFQKSAGSQVRESRISIDEIVPLYLFHF